MTLEHELGLFKPFTNVAHETLLSIVLSGGLLLNEGRRILRPFGITESQFNILMLLGLQSDDGRMSQTRLGGMLMVNRSDVTGLVDRMERSGLVRRIPDPDDRRVNLVELTPHGREVFRQAHDVYYKAISAIMSPLSHDDQIHLCELLARVRERIRTMQKD